jgi:hypothetical protein
MLLGLWKSVMNLIPVKAEVHSAQCRESVELHGKNSFSNWRVAEFWQIGWSSGHHRHPAGLDDIFIIAPQFAHFQAP